MFVHLSLSSFSHNLSSIEQLNDPVIDAVELGEHLVHVEHVHVDAFAEDDFALVREGRRVRQVAANLLHVIMILDRHAEDNRLLVVILLSWSGQPNGLFEVQSCAHH